jgi:hypothetical protein
MFMNHVRGHLSADVTYRPGDELGQWVIGDQHGTILHHLPPIKEELITANIMRGRLLITAGLKRDEDCCYFAQNCDYFKACGFGLIVYCGDSSREFATLKSLQERHGQPKPLLLDLNSDHEGIHSDDEWGLNLWQRRLLFWHLAWTRCNAETQRRTLVCCSQGRHRSFEEVAVAYTLFFGLTYRMAKERARVERMEHLRFYSVRPQGIPIGNYNTFHPICYICRRIWCQTSDHCEMCGWWLSDTKRDQLREVDTTDFW